MHTLKLPPFCKRQIYFSELIVPSYFFQGELGFLYLDLYSRKGKYPGCAHFAIRGGRKVSETEYQLPVCIRIELHVCQQLLINIIPSLTTAVCLYLIKLFCDASVLVSVKLYRHGVLPIIIINHAIIKNIVKTYLLLWGDRSGLILW